MMSERDIIERYFLRGPQRAEVSLSIGDDAAVLQPLAGLSLVCTTDTLVEGRHFLPETDPYQLGFKSLAVNLSDLAAMGAEPAYALLSLTLPEAQPGWLQAYSDGFFSLAQRHGVALIGGNLARGPLSITVQAMGYCPPGTALTRSGARPGHQICVSGRLGLAAFGLSQLLGRRSLPAEQASRCLKQLHAPEPRIALGLAIRPLASAACDISDGLLKDLGRILNSSGVGAIVDVDQVPREPEASPDGVEALTAALHGGEDYELVFIVPPEHMAGVQALTADHDLHVIGHITQTPGLVLRRHGQPWQADGEGYDHFG